MTKKVLLVSKQKECGTVCSVTSCLVCGGHVTWDPGMGAGSGG